MARPIKETPILYGEDARRFEARMQERRRILDKDVSFYLHSVDRRYNEVPENIYSIEQKGVLQKPAEGTDRSIETNYDFAACTVSKDKISINGNEISVAGGIALASRQAIVKFTLLDQNGNALDNVYRLKIKTPKGNYLTLT